MPVLHFISLWTFLGCSDSSRPFEFLCKPQIPYLSAFLPVQESQAGPRDPSRYGISVADPSEETQKKIYILLRKKAFARKVLPLHIEVLSSQVRGYEGGHLWI